MLAIRIYCGFSLLYGLVLLLAVPLNRSAALKGGHNLQNILEMAPLLAIAGTCLLVGRWWSMIVIICVGLLAIAYGIATGHLVSCGVYGATLFVSAAYVLFLARRRQIPAMIHLCAAVSTCVFIGHARAQNLDRTIKVEALDWDCGFVVRPRSTTWSFLITQPGGYSFKGRRRLHLCPPHAVGILRFANRGAQRRSARLAVNHMIASVITFPAASRDDGLWPLFCDRDA
jgi:hypothetical protein